MRKINTVSKTTSFKRMSSDKQLQFKIQRAKGFERRFFRAPDCISVEVPQVLWVPSRAPVLPLPWSTSYSHLPLGRNISLWKMHIILFGWTQSATRIFTQNLACFTKIPVLFHCPDSPKSSSDPCFWSNGANLSASLHFSFIWATFSQWQSLSINQSITSVLLVDRFTFVLLT